MGARDFSGTDQKLDCGSDSSIDSFTTFSVSLWINQDTSAALMALAGKHDNGPFTVGWSLGPASGDTSFVINVRWTTTTGIWTFGTPVVTTPMHVCITYDSGSTANNPVAYINGVSVTVNRIVGPAGSFANDAATNLLVGLNPDNSGDYDGRISHFCYDNAVWTAAQANRACWWGEPGGAVKVKHRLTTDKLTNEGTATADATATGATMGAPIGCPVSPKGSVLMGMGVGW